IRRGIRIRIRLDALPGTDPNRIAYAGQRARHSGEGGPAVGRLFTGAGGAVSADIGVDGTLPQVLQPLSIAHARARGGKRRVDDRTGCSAGDGTVHPNFKLAVVFES